MKSVVCVLVLVGGIAHAERRLSNLSDEVAIRDSPADVCTDTVVDPVTTPVRDVAIDAQRTACLRDELSGHVLAAALVDTPGFHGELDGEARLLGRARIGRRWEIDLGVRMVRYAFVQNAVNKGTELQFGPFSVGGMYSNKLGPTARAALVATLELPYTREQRDTFHISGEITGVVTAQLRPRTYLHARLGWLAMHAHSAGGVTHRMAFRAGLDLVRRLRRGVSLQLGADMQAGWYDGFDHVNVRAGVQWRFGGMWRGAVGVGVPVGGDERTNALFDLAIARDLR